MDHTQTVSALFKLLWQHYIAKMPQAQKAIEIVQKAGDEFVNDHVAFRTFGLEGLGITALDRIFLSLSYKKMDYMNFTEKKLNAFWYYPPDLSLPKVFISELRVRELSEEAQEIILDYTNGHSTGIKGMDFKKPKTVAPALSTQARPWDIPSFEDYQALATESEYAAWVLAYGNELNHFTISVNFLKRIRGLKALNDLLEAGGITLNDAGDKIKGTAEELLIQSSTVADQVDYAFSDGTQRIPYSYLEFAERFPVPQKIKWMSEDELRSIPYNLYYQGFIPGNADKIFESTYQAQAKKLGPKS